MTIQNLIPPDNSNRIDFIDVWRFLAIVMVIQAHILVFSGVEAPLLAPYLLPLDRLSELGVFAFFFISGFVICSGLIKEKTTTGTVCLKAFYLRRSLRIIPPLWLYLICISFLHYIDITNTTPIQAITSALFLCNMPFEDGCSWFAGHTWSLAYEEQFYLLFPFIFIGIFHMQPAKKLGIIIGGLTLASLLVRFNGYPVLADFGMYFLFLLHGCLAALLTQGNIKRAYPLSVSLWLLTIAALLFCISYFSVATEIYVRTLFYPPLISIIVFCTPMHNPRIAAFFSNTTMRYLGRISYTVYLWQELATAYYPNPSLLATFSYLALVFVLAILSFQYIETPLAIMASKRSRQLQLQQLNK
ncbi:MAG: acyltransferase [Methylococcales bacterium]|nr:acyltransferase [Methylococcales bacterium]